MICIFRGRSTFKDRPSTNIILGINDSTIFVAFSHLVFLLVTIIKYPLERAKLKTDYRESPDSLLDLLNNVRLGTMLENSKKSGKQKGTYMLEELNDVQKRIMIALNVENAHNEPPKIKMLVYTYKSYVSLCVSAGYGILSLLS